MSTPKKKLCWNCEGRVSFKDENCPYCGVYISPLGEEEGTQDKENLFSPPYRVEQETEEQEVPSSPFSAKDSTEDGSENAQAALSNNPSIPAAHDMQSIVLPMILLLSGSVFFLFGIALLFFSEQGYLTLKWNSSYWYIFSALAIPMLLFGWHFLQKDGYET